MFCLTQVYPQISHLACPTENRKSLQQKCDLEICPKSAEASKLLK